MKRTRIILTALATISLDQLSKWYLLEIVGMKARPPIEVTDFFSLVMVWNKGVSFGMFNGQQGPWPLIAIALIISVLLARLAWKSEKRWEHIGYALVIGGALGNVIDRLRFGAVADFFYAHIGDLGWPAFNVADSAICIGVGILLLEMLISPRRA